MNSLNTVGVVGGGLMGSGIAAKLAAGGRRVVVHDSNASVRAGVTQRCTHVFEELGRAGMLDAVSKEAAMGRISVASTLDELSATDFVIEAVVEELSVKVDIFSDLEAILRPEVVIASTTSGIPLDRLTEQLARPENFLVAHFWNPPHIIRMVEVVPGIFTSSASVQSCLQLLRSSDCDPVVLKKSVPGFIGNRIQFAVLREALHMLDTGVADAETIDYVITQTVGRRYRWSGPLQSADVGGLKTFMSVSSQLWPELCADEEPLAGLQRLVDSGDFGYASGKGIFTWDDERRQRLEQTRLRMLQDIIKN